MRARIVKLTALALFAAAPSVAQPPTNPASAPPAKGQPEKPKPAQPTLEDILAAALRNNPDIRVAEAKQREADAELNRVRLAVIQKMTRLYQELQAARADCARIEVVLRRHQELRKKGYVATAEVQAAEADLAKAKANVARLESELPYVLGPRAARKGEYTLEFDRVHCPGFRGTGHMYGDNCMSCHTPTAQFLKFVSIHGKPIQTPMTEAVRQALDRTVALKMPDRDVDLKEVLAVLTEATKAGGGPEVSFWLQGHAAEARVRLPHQTLPLGAYLLALEDLAGVRFTVREYGILVTSDAPFVPPGAQSLREFWKGGTAKK